MAVVSGRRGASFVFLKRLSTAVVKLILKGWLCIPAGVFGRLLAWLLVFFLCLLS